jgi:hypothetical protein
MNVSRRASEMANETAPQRAWIRPAVQRLAAGCAENGAPSGTPDIGVNFS